jgi:hypothetical protein
VTRVAAAAILLLLTAALVGAQVASYGVPDGGTGLSPGEVPPERNGFSFCRLQYRSVTTETLGSGWTTDYPAADRNLMVRLAEITTIPVNMGTLEEPLHVVVRATDRNVFQCPFLFASDVGTIGFLDAEIVALRDYLMKGGFLWVDDFWGPTALNRWAVEIGRVLPGLPIVELPMDHPLFQTFFKIERVPQIPAISFWLTMKTTSERGGASAEPRIYGIFDEKGRLLVLMSHNTDIADGWEREGENEEFFHTFSPGGYAVGVNVVIWNMTH